jgi:hypothetical protein
MICKVLPKMKGASFFNENKQKVYKYNHIWLHDSEKLKKERKKTSARRTQ